MSKKRDQLDDKCIGGGSGRTARSAAISLLSNPVFVCFWRRLDKFCDRDVAPFTDAPPMQLDPRDFVERVCGEITGSTMRTANDRDFLNDQQCRAFALAARYRFDLYASAPAVLAVISYSAIPHIRY